MLGHVGIILIVFLAVYRKDKTLLEVALHEKEDATFESVGMELEDIPDVVTSEMTSTWKTIWNY